MQAGSATVPHRNPVPATICDIEIGRGRGRLEHELRDAVSPPSASRRRASVLECGPEGSGPLSLNRKVRLPQRGDEFELLGKTADGPGQPAHPCAEWRVTLLRIRAAIASVLD